MYGYHYFLLIMLSVFLILFARWSKYFGGKLCRLIDALIEQQTLKNKMIKANAKLLDLQHSQAVIDALKKQQKK